MGGIRQTAMRGWKLKWVVLFCAVASVWSHGCGMHGSEPEGAYSESVEELSKFVTVDLQGVQAKWCTVSVTTGGSSRVPGPSDWYLLAELTYEESDQFDKALSGLDVSKGRRDAEIPYCTWLSEEAARYAMTSNDKRVFVFRVPQVSIGDPVGFRKQGSLRQGLGIGLPEERKIILYFYTM